MTNVNADLAPGEAYSYDLEWSPDAIKPPIRQRVRGVPPAYIECASPSSLLQGRLLCSGQGLVPHQRCARRATMECAIPTRSLECPEQWGQRSLGFWVSLAGMAWDLARARCAARPHRERAPLPGRCGVGVRGSGTLVSTIFGGPGLGSMSASRCLCTPIAFPQTSWRHKAWPSAGAGELGPKLEYFYSMQSTIHGSCCPIQVWRNRCCHALFWQIN